MPFTDLGEDFYEPDFPDYRGVACLASLAVFIIVIVVAVCSATLPVKAGTPFCDVVGSQTVITEGLDVAEYDDVKKVWRGVPNETFENKPYAIIPGPEGGLYTLFEGIGGGVIIVPFNSLKTSDDGWQHDTCGYLITWAP